MFTFAGLVLLGYSVPNLAKGVFLMVKKEKAVSIDDEQYPDADE
jgi:hypothetical protein